jgi:addiction module RelE/StbE family toxin
MEKILLDLKKEKDPESLGEKKNGELKQYRTIRINKNHRIMYKVVKENGNNVVVLLRICDHADVYAPLK